jgi:hypothetical protein
MKRWEQVNRVKLKSYAVGEKSGLIQTADIPSHPGKSLGSLSYADY